MKTMEDLSGKRYGNWTVVEYYKEESRNIRWLCKCDCGAIKPIRSTALKSGKSTNCGCMRSKSFVGNKYGKLLVLEEHRVDGKLFCKCRCDCGNHCDIYKFHLSNGHTKSCGCSRNENKPIKHGYSKTRLYGIWGNMKRRCTDPKSDNYNYYGGRGISICDEWLNDSSSFINWAINNGYEKHLTLDRIDPDGNYCPENCRWITQKEQSNNTRKNRYIEYEDERLTLAQWSDKTGIRVSTLFYRLKSGWNIKDVLTKEVRNWDVIKQRERVNDEKEKQS